jgi:hypothetical protein
VVNVTEINTIKPAELHFTPSGGIRKKIKELKEKIDQTRP